MDAKKVFLLSTALTGAFARTINGLVVSGDINSEENHEEILTSILGFSLITIMSNLTQREVTAKEIVGVMPNAMNNVFLISDELNFYTEQIQKFENQSEYFNDIEKLKVLLQNSEYKPYNIKDEYNDDLAQ